MTHQTTLVRGIPTPAHIVPYVEALGVEDAIAFFLAIGGSTIYLPRFRSGDKSVAATIVGAEKVRALADRLDLDYVKVPLARQWTAKQLCRQGETVNDIARTIRVDVSTVHRYLSGDE
jgi:hypothetical protein